MNTHNDTGNIHVRRMIGNKNVLLTSVMWRLINFFVPDANHEIPDLSPDIACFINKIACPYFAEKEINQHQHKNDEH